MATETRMRSASTRRLGVEIFLFFLLLYLLTANGRIVNRDGEAVFQVASSIAERGSFDVPAESVFETSVGPRGTEGDSLSFATETAMRGKDGRLYAMYGLGQSLVSVPFYYAGKLVALVIPQMSPFFTTRFAAAMLNPFVAALTCAILFFYAHHLGFALRACLVTTLMYGTATMAWPYAKSYAGEPLVGLLLVVAAFCLVRSRSAHEPLRWFAISGAALGFAVTVRVSAGILLPVFLGYCLALLLSKDSKGALSPILEGPSMKDSPKGRGGLKGSPFNFLPSLSERGGFERDPLHPPSSTLCPSLQAFLLPIAFFLSLVGWYNYARFGSPIVTGYQSIAWNRPFVDGLYGLLLSPGKGLFWYSPVLLLSLIASVTFFRWRRREALFIASLILVWLVFHAQYRFWEGGWSWGPRLMLPILPFILLPIATLVVRLWRFAECHPEERDEGSGASDGQTSRSFVLPKEGLRMTVTLSGDSNNRLLCGETLGLHHGTLIKIARRLLPVAVVLGLVVQILGVGVDYTRYLWTSYSSGPDDHYARVVHQLSGSPLVGQWGELAAAVGNAVGTDALATARGEITQKADGWRMAGLSEPAISVAVLTETQVVGLNFPDFWFIYLYLFGASPALIALLLVPLLAGAMGMLAVLDRRFRALKEERSWSQ